MTFSLADVDRSREPLRAFEGSDLRGLNAAELLKLQHLMAAGRQAWDIATAGVANELASRSTIEDGRNGLARQQGFSSPGKMVATILGTTVSEGEKLVQAGKTLADAELAIETSPQTPMRPVAAGLREGWLSLPKANLITGTVGQLSGDTLALEHKLVELARRLDLYALRTACQWEAAEFDPPALAERERQQFAARDLSLSESSEGTVLVRGVLDKVSGATLRTWLDAQVRAGLQAKREDPSDDRTAGQMRVDALLTLVRHGLDCDAPGSGVKSLVVVRSWRTELEKELGIGECDALGGPISTATLRAMAVDASILPVVMGGDSVVLDMGRSTRLYTPEQSIALGERDGGCAYCHAPRSWCATHHIVFWRDDGPSDLSNGVLLCTRHHNMVHHDGWNIRIDDRNRVWFIPPAQLDRERTPRLGGRAALRDLLEA